MWIYIFVKMCLEYHLCKYFTTKEFWQTCRLTFPINISSLWDFVRLALSFLNKYHHKIEQARIKQYIYQFSSILSLWKFNILNRLPKFSKLRKSYNLFWNIKNLRYCVSFMEAIIGWSGDCSPLNTKFRLLPSFSASDIIIL